MNESKHYEVWDKELEVLNDLYKKSHTQSQFLILSGRRRLGKTYLLKKFIKGKPFIYYLATQGSIKDQLRFAARITLEHYKETEVKESQFADWDTLLRYIAQKAKQKNEHLVLILDELSNLIGSEKSISLSFQNAWEKHLKFSNIFLIAVGTYNQLLIKNPPSFSALFFNKKTHEMNLRSFTFLQAKPMFNSASFENCFSLYALIGGVPEYIKKVDAQKSLKENIKNNILSRVSFLSIEPQLLLSEEFNEPRKYFTILEAIGLGWVKYGEILEKTGFANNVLSKYLNTLINLQLVHRKYPVTDNPSKSKKGIYFIADYFLRLYFNFVLPNLSHIELGEIDTVYDKNQEIIQVLIGRAYELFAQEIVVQLSASNRLPGFDRMNRWWDKNIKIDGVGLSAGTNSIIFAKTKWSGEAIGIEALSDLKHKAKKVKWGKKNRKEYYILFSKTGFTKELADLASLDPHVLLVHGDKVLN